MVYCEGVKDWLKCINCERLYSTYCPIQRGDIEELIKQINLTEAQEMDFFIEELEGPCGQA